jgi:hypothetical protein
MYAPAIKRAALGMPNVEAAADTERAPAVSL